MPSYPDENNLWEAAMAITSQSLPFPAPAVKTWPRVWICPRVNPGLCALCPRFTCTKDIFAATRIASGLAERGIAVLRFDFTGLGHSDGEFANTNFSSNVRGPGEGGGLPADRP